MANTRVNLLDKFEHRLSHRRLLIQPVIATAVNATQVKCTAEHKWINPADHATFGLPRPVTDLLVRMTDGELI